MTRWMKLAAVAAVGLISVPVMGLTILPSKPAAKPAVAPVKVTKINHVAPVKKATTLAKPVAKNISPRPASVRLGKNVLPAKTVAHTTLSKTASKAKPAVASKTPIKPTTLHSGPGKLPTPKSALPKAMARTHTTMN